jgi:hypothetical protein
VANKEIRQVVRNLKRRGILVKPTKKAHFCVVTPAGPVFCSSTPSDIRAIRNLVSMLKRKGVKL